MPYLGRLSLSTVSKVLGASSHQGAFLQTQLHRRLGQEEAGKTMVGLENLRRSPRELNKQIKQKPIS